MSPSGRREHTVGQRLGYYMDAAGSQSFFSQWKRRICTCMSLFVSDLSVHQLFVCGEKDDDGGEHGNIIITESLQN